MNTGTKFWLAVGVIACMVSLLAIYFLKVDAPNEIIVGAIVGVITLIVGAYFKANVDASGQYLMSPLAAARAVPASPSADAKATAGPAVGGSASPARS